MKSKRPLNDIGVWLMHELDCRDIRRKEFANMIQTTPQNLSDILRGNRFSASTLQRWRVRFENALIDFDEKRGIEHSTTTVYQAICTNVIIEGNTYTAYGIQMLSGKSGHPLHSLPSRSRILAGVRIGRPYHHCIPSVLSHHSPDSLHPFVMNISHILNFQSTKRPLIHRVLH